MERGLLGLAPRASHPSRQDLQRTPGRGTGIEHAPGATRPALPDLQSMSSLAMCDLVSHDRPGHEPVPHPRPPGVVGETVAPHDPVRGEKPRREDRQGNPYLMASSASATGGSSAAAASSRPWSPSPAPSGHHPAPAHQPDRLLPRTRRRLLRQPDRQRPQGPQPHPPARGARVHRHPCPRRLTCPTTHATPPMTSRFAGFPSNLSAPPEK
jgi:hypothetical protein